MFIRAVSKSSEFDPTEFLTLFGDIQAKSVTDLINGVARLCPKGELQELSVFAHGAGGAFTIGTDHIGGITRPGQDPLYKLAPLWDYFYSTAALVLCVCEGGKNEALLTEIARTINAPVFGCTGDVRPILGFPQHGWWSGRIVGAYPDGHVENPDKIPEPPPILA